MHFENASNKLRNNVIQLDLVNRKPQDRNRTTYKVQKMLYAIIKQLLLVISSLAFVCMI